MRILTPLLLSTFLTLGLGTAGFAGDTPGTITVTGSSTITVVPDLATISLGVTTNGTTAAAAMSANSDALAAVMTRLKATGIDDRDMQTSNLSINPNWVTNAAGTASEIHGYIANNMLTVRIKAIGTTGIVLDAAVSDGANTLNGLTFGLLDQRPTEDQARKQAVADALARANLLAAASGAKLGPILSIAEADGLQPQPYQTFSKSDAAAVPVAAGEVGITASVTIVFQIGE